MRFGSVCSLLVLLLPLTVLSQGDLSLSDAVDQDNKLSTTTKRPRAPVRGTGGVGGDFNLEDALDSNNDENTNKNKKQAGDFSDSDLSDVINDKTYKPDKGKGGQQSGDTSQNKHHDENSGMSTEVFTIAGIISAVGMALVSAISSYITYQKKKLCFSIQQSLNTDVMTENPEAVVATEPKVHQTLEATKC